MRKLIVVFFLIISAGFLTSGIYAEDGNSSIIVQPFSSIGQVIDYPVKGLKFSDSPTTGPALNEPDMVWVENTLASMTLDEKVGQMIVTSDHANGESHIDNYKVGGFVFLGNGQLASNIVASVNRLQNYAPLGLLFSIDSEPGLGGRVSDATIFPLIMALGAADDPALAEQLGRITARESRSLGIQITYSPVVDVNTEPINPIISTRSYGDDPELVARMARNFIKGARAEGILCTFKHYPGHGATAGDSHSSLPTVDLPLQELKAKHIKPYSLLAATGDVDMVMTAHVWYSQVDTSGAWPATLSPTFLKTILRDEIGFNGLVVSDSFGMGGLAIAVPDEQERAVVGVEAGLDIILNPPTVSAAFTGIKNAVTSSRISINTINNSVRRVLIAKSRVGIPDVTTVDPALYTTVLRHPEHIAVVKKICEKAVTKAKYTLSQDTPLTSATKTLCVTLAASQTIFYSLSNTYFTTPLKQKVPNTTVMNASTTINSTQRNAIVNAAKLNDVVIVAGYDWWKINSANQITLINSLCALNVPIIYVGFGAPYHYLSIPDVDAFYCGYSSCQQMQEVMVDVLLGKDAPGNLPVYVDGLRKYANELIAY